MFMIKLGSILILIAAMGRLTICLFLGRPNCYPFILITVITVILLTVILLPYSLLSFYPPHCNHCYPPHCYPAILLTVTPVIINVNIINSVIAYIVKPKDTD